MYRRIHRLGGYLAALGICLLVICGLQALLLDQGRQEEPWATDRGGGVKEEKGEEKKSTGEDIGGEMGNPNIRVLIMSTGYENVAHPEVTVTAAGGLVVESGQGTEEMEAGQPLTLRPDDGRFAAGKVRIQAKDGGDLTLASIKRGCGQPSYAGVLELRTTAEGIVIINELPVESYLCRVVPSEMPASYELEALKAQAVCARSYAFRQMAEYGYPEYEAHVNDSTDYQVYGNSAVRNRLQRLWKKRQGR